MEELKSIIRSIALELAALAGFAFIMFIKSLRGKFIAQNLEVQTINKESNMEKNLVVSSEAKVDVKLAAGKLFLIAKYDGADVDADVTVGIEVDLLLDKVKGLIPGAIDDAIIEVLKAALKVV